MRLFTKIFLFGVLVFGLAFSASGYFLLHYSLESSLAREADFALKQYQYDKFTVQSAMLTTTVITVSLDFSNQYWQDDFQAFSIWEPLSEEYISLEEYSAEDLFSALASELSVPAAFFAQDRSLLYSSIQGLDSAFLDDLTENVHAWQYCKTGESVSILVGSILQWNGQSIYFVTQWDISKTLLQQDTLRQYFLRSYLKKRILWQILPMS